MHYHIILTTDCNSLCTYCHKKSYEETGSKINKKFKFDFTSPIKSEVNISSLKKFLARDKDPVLIFYGGEPLMEIEKIREIMDNIDVEYRMQTNGKLLYKLPRKYTNRMDKILVSLDGNRERTDLNKGEGTFDKVMENLTYIRKNGFKGEIVARMTISNFSDIYEQVLSLINTGFTSIHWQLDAGFYESDYDHEKFKKFIEDYDRSITKLIDLYLNSLKKGKVLKIYPFIGIIDSLLKNEKTKLRCGAGHSGYAIGTDGKIYACPIMSSIIDFEAGDLSTNPNNLLIFDVEGRCLKCDIKDLCGGRCLYWNKAELWPKKGDDLICKSTKHLITELKRILPEIKKLIDKKTIRSNAFEYEKYFGPEIIP